jgi:predicted ArsR family transcriptional regulator
MTNDVTQMPNATHKIVKALLNHRTLNAKQAALVTLLNRSTCSRILAHLGREGYANRATDHRNQKPNTRPPIAYALNDKGREHAAKLGIRA